MRDFHIKAHPLCESLKGKSRKHAEILSAAEAKLRSNPNTGSRVRGAHDARQIVRYPGTAIPGYPQVDIVYLVAGEMVTILGCREV